MLAQSGRLLQHSNADLTQASALRLVAPHEAGELDSAGEAGGPSAHEYDVQFDAIVSGRLGEDQPLAGERRLIAGGNQAPHRRQPARSFLISWVRRGRTSKRSPTMP